MFVFNSSHRPTMSSRICQNSPQRRLRSAGWPTCVCGPSTLTSVWASLSPGGCGSAGRGPPRREAKPRSDSRRCNTSMGRCALSGKVEKPVQEEWGKTLPVKEAARALAKNLNQALWELHALSYAVDAALSVTPWRATSQRSRRDSSGRWRPPDQPPQAGPPPGWAGGVSPGKVHC